LVKLNDFEDDIEFFWNNYQHQFSVKIFGCYVYGSEVYFFVRKKMKEFNRTIPK